MATRNGELYIGEQLASILPQLRPADELIISDDSSTDRTMEIIAGFADARIVLLPGNTFYNAIFNFENALRRASGDIIVLADQDDVWLENKIPLIRERLQGRTAQSHLLVLDGYIADSEGRITGDSIFTRMRSGPGLMKNLYDNTYMGCCMAFSRPLLEIALPFPKGIPMHDMWLGMLAELFGTVEFVPEKTVKYRKHQGSTIRFERRFRPLTQIRWRLLLSWFLTARWTARRFGGRANG